MASTAVARLRIPANLDLLDHQRAVIEARTVGGHRWRIALHHRQSGKDTTGLVDVASAAVAAPGVYGYIAPTRSMVQSIVWDGRRAHDGEPYLSVIPAPLILGRNENELALELRTRHSGKQSRLLFLSGDQPDRLRGLPLKGCVITEYAQFRSSEVLDIVRPALNASGGWCLIITTPMGVSGHFSALWSSVQGLPDWWTDVRTIEDTHYLDGRPMIARGDIERELAAGQRLEWVRQEYYCEFVVGLVSSIFGDVLTKAEQENRILDLPLRGDRPTICALDLGVNDSTVATLVQESGEWLDVVDVAAYQNLALPSILQGVQARGFTIREWIAPHDIEQRDLTALGHGGLALTRREVARRLGVHFRVAPRLPLAEGLDAVRRTFARLRFDRKRCAKLIEALSEYQRSWDPRTKSYADKPLHNWASDYADSLRTFCTGYRPRDEDDGRGRPTLYARTATSPWTTPRPVNPSRW